MARLAGSSGPLLEVVQAGPLHLPTDLFSAIAPFALTNGALFNRVAIVATTALALVLIVSGDLSELADTTVLLLLLVFTAVNIAVLVLRRDPVEHHHFRAPTVVPVVGAVVSVALMTTKNAQTFARAGALVRLGLVLWGINWWLHARHVTRTRPASSRPSSAGSPSERKRVGAPLRPAGTRRTIHTCRSQPEDASSSDMTAPTRPTGRSRPASARVLPRAA